MDAEALADLVRRAGGKPFRARQIREAYFLGSRSFAEITVLPIALREALDADSAVTSLREVSTVGSTADALKFLFELHDGRRIESVLLFEEPRVTACLSTQVGCPAGCVFCASGLDGLTRNLSTAEIVDQFLQMQRTVPKKGGGITNVVVMGMGEPFLNYEATVAAVRSLNAREGCGVGARRITVSTVGIPDKIVAFAREGLQVNLAVSLHAADEDTRSRLVPLNRRHGIRDIVRAARTYFEMTGREVTFEYVLLQDVNTGIEHADGLVRLLKDQQCSVNLIPFNKVDGLTWHNPAPEVCKAFLDRLKAGGVTATMRKRKGDEHAAACGQLRLASQEQDRGF